jgi:hypothetical protein
LIILPLSGETPQESAKRIKEAAGFPAGIKVVLECTGFESSIHTGIYVRFILLLPVPPSSLQLAYIVRRHAMA